MLRKATKIKMDKFPVISFGSRDHKIETKIPLAPFYVQKSEGIQILEAVKFIPAPLSPFADLPSCAYAGNKSRLLPGG